MTEQEQREAMMIKFDGKKHYIERYFSMDYGVVKVIEIVPKHKVVSDMDK